MSILEPNIKKRNLIAKKYNKEFNGLPLVLPKIFNQDYRDVFNSYVIRTKFQNQLFKFLRKNKIEALINWPKPLYKHKGLRLGKHYLRNTEKICKEIISLPIFPEIKESEIKFITNTVKQFFKNRSK